MGFSTKDENCLALPILRFMGYFNFNLTVYCIYFASQADIGDNEIIDFNTSIYWYFSLFWLCVTNGFNISYLQGVDNYCIRKCSSGCTTKKTQGSYIFPETKRVSKLSVNCILLALLHNYSSTCNTI